MTALRRSLPLLEARHAETRLCTYCPKLCRPACPVATEEGRESVTPWGIMRGLDELTRAAQPDDEGTRARLASAWSCTSCGRCRTLCLHENPVADTVLDARADAFAAGFAPAPASALVASFGARLARIEHAAEALHDDGAVRADESVVFIPGCTSVLFDADHVRRATRAVRRLSPSGACVAAADLCCGAPLLDAGDREGFIKHARRIALDLGRYSHLVVGDAGCAHTLRVTYARVGVAPSTWQRVEHLAELAARNTHLLRTLPEPRRVIVHDACKLGRAMGVYEAPRTVLRAAFGRVPTELAASRERGFCSGAGGLLPLTSPMTANTLARTLADEAREAAAGEDFVVVSACASTVRSLTTAGVAATSFAAVVGRAALE